MPQLDEDDAGLLAFEGRRWPSTLDKHRAIAEQFGCTPLRYYQRLNTIIDTEAALARDPLLVNRLRRIRDTRRARIRSAGSRG